MSQVTLSAFIERTADKLKIPGVAAGVLVDGQETFAGCHGATSIENPLPVDPDTLFGLGSVSKTFTATALMRLVAEGKVELEAPVRRYVPELRLADERTAAASARRQPRRGLGVLGDGPATLGPVPSG